MPILDVVLPETAARALPPDIDVQKWAHLRRTIKLRECLLRSPFVKFAGYGDFSAITVVPRISIF